MNTFARQCISLRKKDYSLPEISKITGRAKPSIYYYIQNLPLSAERVLQTRKKNATHMRSLVLGRKGLSAKAFVPFDNWNKNTVLLTAHLLFDGETSPRKGCTYNNRNKALLNRVERCMQEIYAFKPKYYQNTFTGVQRVSYYNVALGAYMQKKTLQLQKEIGILPLELKRYFLKAFFDDEGCMDFRPAQKRRKIRGYQKDNCILHIIKLLLSDFGIESSVQKPNEVVVSGKENLLKFQKEINFSPGVFINGNRTNSIWKKHLEKRDILDRAIASFKV